MLVCYAITFIDGFVKNLGGGGGGGGCVVVLMILVVLVVVVGDGGEGERVLAEKGNL